VKTEIAEIKAKIADVENAVHLDVTERPSGGNSGAM